MPKDELIDCGTCSKNDTDDCGKCNMYDKWAPIEVDWEAKYHELKTWTDKHINELKENSKTFCDTFEENQKLKDYIIDHLVLRETDE